MFRPFITICCLSVWGAVASADPRDAHSLCLPIGTPSVSGYGALLPLGQGGSSQTVLSGVPGYQWYHGCGPTAVGMVLGYWDTQGFDLLIPGDASTQSAAVNQAIASNEHYADYALPIDSPSTGLLSDKSLTGNAHVSNSIADFMQTSWSTRNNYYGWSWFSDIDNALTGYTSYTNSAYGSNYQATAYGRTWGSFTWSQYLAEIDAGRPLVLLVDTDGNGGTDHFVTAVGYRDINGYNEYACLDTWAPSDQIRWESFQGLKSGNSWGIYGATYFSITPEPGMMVIVALAVACGVIARRRR